MNTYSQTVPAAFHSLRAPDQPGDSKSLFSEEPTALSLKAIGLLQNHLIHQQDWIHNFGFEAQDLPIVGKMFGVMVVQTQDEQWGFLAAFSGKLAGSNQHPYFVPPVFDGLAEEGFLNEGMTALSLMNERIRLYMAENLPLSRDKVLELKTERRLHSIALQNQLFDQYHFLNYKGESKSLRAIFHKANGKNPPVGAGECAAPKLLQYAFQHGLKPINLTEFWWGLSPKSARWKHNHYYPPCKEKCHPILNYMLPEALQNNLKEFYEY